MSKSVTMSDIAERLGISTVAVSKALSGQKGVSTELREQVKKTASEMGYKGKSSVQKKSSLSNNIGLLVAERYISDNSFYFKFIRALSTEMQKKGNYVFLHTLTQKSEDNGVLPDIFFHQRVDGIIILGQIADKYTKAVLDTKIPIVFLDFYNELTSDSCIISDSFYGTYEMTNYLIANGQDRKSVV